MPCKGQAALFVQSAQRTRSSEIAFLRTVLVWLSTCIPYQLNIVSDYAITQYRTNASEIAHLVRIVCSGLKEKNVFDIIVPTLSHSQYPPVMRSQSPHEHPFITPLTTTHSHTNHTTTTPPDVAAIKTPPGPACLMACRTAGSRRSGCTRLVASFCPGISARPCAS